MRYNPNIYIGLSDEQVKLRNEEGLVNYDTDIKTISIKKIIYKNIFTMFNLLNLGIALCIFFVHSYKNLLFLGIVFCNTIISIIQEIHAKKTIDRLNVIATSKLCVLREGKEKMVSIHSIVLDDIVKYKLGNQVVADSIIMDGIVEVDESFITGESNHVLKKVGDMLLSGSFIVSGNCVCKVEHVGLDNYTAKISNEAKYIKKVNSVIVNTLNRIIKIISFVIIPLGFILFLRQYGEVNLSKAVVASSAAIISMIPEGLVLLTSSVFFISALRLAKKNVLVQDLYCAESLARVDTICLDKTGTLTKGTIELIKVVPIDNKYSMGEVLSSISNGLKGDNKTMDAIYNVYNKKTDYIVTNKVPFSSSRKYSGVSFKDKGTFILGAKEMLCKDEKVFEKYSNYRTIALMHSDNDFSGYDLPKNMKLIGILVFQDEIRDNAIDTLNYLKKEDVDIKIITGDSVSSTVAILDRLGIEHKVIDMSKVKNTDNLKEIVCDYNVFCRVKPEEKKEIVMSLRANGKNVAFGGDGVNDVLALREADSSISIASGSEAARNVAQVVLMDSDFKSVPSIIKEGRRAVNNLERSGCLFLTKTTYSTLLAIVFLFLSMAYPFEPIQMSLISGITIGIPSFILALESNNKRITGNFFINVISKSIPSAITIVLDILIVMLFSYIFKFSNGATSTMAVMLVAFTGFILLFKLCYPFTKLRISLYIFLVTVFVLCVFILHSLFDLVLLTPFMMLTLLSLSILDVALFTELSYFFDKKIEKHHDKIISKTK